jgi:hypothetical protein
MGYRRCDLLSTRIRLNSLQIKFVLIWCLIVGLKKFLRNFIFRNLEIHLMNYMMDVQT